MCERKVERGEPGKIYYMRNTSGRAETLYKVDELAYTLLMEKSSTSVLADRMGLYGTTLHYLAVQQAMMSVHRPVYSKIMQHITLFAYLKN